MVTRVVRRFGNCTMTKYQGPTPLTSEKKKKIVSPSLRSSLGSDSDVADIVFTAVCGMDSGTTTLLLMFNTY